jgi:hypothetical protein
LKSWADKKENAGKETKQGRFRKAALLLCRKAMHKKARKKWQNDLDTQEGAWYNKMLLYPPAKRV